ncbi:MAG: calcium/sodium antiporter [Shimia sp.]|uniref:calcium/sodium antiporter n=1 Tax=Shimia sp. TaxID=1954381 RepID=UPI0025EDBEE7|nr:calcium/sodium antiporter [Shimia sp.]MCH2066779.1 calcium/sodium antiporter [Shimia sp.]
MTAGIMIAIGLTGLFVGGEMLVRGAVTIAKAYGLPPMVIGLTLVGFGTSTPELVTSVQAALSGSAGIAIGNVVGSNIGNILLILGVSAMLLPLAVARDALRRDGSVMIAATLALLGVVLFGEITRWIGVGFVTALAAYLFVVFRSVSKTKETSDAVVYEKEAAAIPGPDLGLSAAIGVAVVGLIATIIGARLLVDGAISVAEFAGISETVIGLTVVAIGTSMPELVTAVIAVRKGQGDVAIGNVIGSNLFNVMGIVGVTALIHPVTVPVEIATFDIWVLLGASVLLIGFARTGWTINRLEGGAFLVAYLGYFGFLLMQ